MKHIYTLVITALAFLFSGQLVVAQDSPFNCDYNAYLFQYNDVYALNLASGGSILVAQDITSGNINATGYNPADGYIWGSVSTPNKTIVRIGANFAVDYVTIDALPNNNRYIGDISADGVYHLKPGGTTFYRIDLDPNSPTYQQALSNGTLSSNLSIHDWAFNAVDNMLYSVEKGTNKLYRIDPNTGVVNSLGVVPILSGLNYTYGAVYFDADGRFYVSANQTGTIYVIQEVQNINTGDALDSNVFAFGPSSSSNDGARCPTAPVPQEDCTNGVDDDGDGLVDCDDPSCSGVATCPVIETSSGANEGGLESNNRLGQAISTRNYNRAKTGVVFNPNQQPVVEQRSSLQAKVSTTQVALADLIPLNVLDNVEQIIATPEDLINITNATEVLAVDFMQDQNPIAAVLGFKTEGRVYEHTKYICDRLLGGELLNVSTLDIDQQPYIVSQIKNPDGTLEFVLSITATLVEEQSKFDVESHWNLDRYSQDNQYFTLQIWANSIDDLLLLGQEYLRLVAANKPIRNRIVSGPPEVYVRKGNYANGNLNLTVVNKNVSSDLIIEGGIRYSETSPIQEVSTTIAINSEYQQEISFPSGALFDLGIRLTANNSTTPDDLFLADGVWGLDNADSTLNIQDYQVIPEDATIQADGLSLERAVNLRASFSQYTAIYRSFNPRFKPVSLDAFNAIAFNASGTGNMEITLVQANIPNWEDQPKAQVALTDAAQNYALSLSSFKRLSGQTINLSETTTVVFTFIANDSPRQLEVFLDELRFKNLSESELITLKPEQTLISPNPLQEATVLSWNARAQETQTLRIHNILGVQIFEQEIRSTQGFNQFELGKVNLASGVYIVSITGSEPVKSSKLVVE